MRDDQQTQASKRVLLESLTVLGANLSGLVIIGGSVPELLLPNHDHAGTLDVDLAVDESKIPKHVYSTIAKRLKAAGYRSRQEANANIFERDCDNVTVKLDIVTGPGIDPAVSVLAAQDMLVPRLKGVDLAIKYSTEVSISGQLPGGEINSLSARVASIPALICMKAITLAERMKEKDAYDIVFCVENFSGGPQALAAEFGALRGDVTAEEAITILRSKFSDARQIGPIWAARFLAAELGRDEEQERQRAFFLVNDLLRFL